MDKDKFTFRQFSIPERMRPAIEAYVLRGQIPGDFLRSIICNDLREACIKADDENLYNIPAYVAYFYQYTPSGCWGSKEKMIDWIEFKKGT